MLVQSGFKYRLYPSKAEAQRFEDWIQSSKFIYNIFLRDNSDAYEHFVRNHGRRDLYIDYLKGQTKAGSEMSIASLKKMEEFPWLEEAIASSLGYAKKHLDQAFKNFFNNIKKGKHYKDAGFPNFKKHKNSFTWIPRPKTSVFLNRRNTNWATVRIPKLHGNRKKDWGEVRIRYHRKIPDGARVVSATISRDGKDWYISLLCEYERKNHIATEGAIAIDRGCALPFVASDGRVFKLPKAILEVEEKIDRLKHKRDKRHRRPTRGVKPSSRWLKKTEQIKRLNTRLTNIRTNWLHEVTSELVSTSDTIVLEKLNTKGMTRSAKGTSEEPGSNVRAKAGLNRAILRVSWAEFERQLEYKLKAIGGRLVFVPAHHTSQKCSRCGIIESSNRISRNFYHCSSCGYQGCADLNAAKNILEKAGEETL